MEISNEAAKQAISQGKMDDMLDSMGDTSPREAFGMLCLALSLLYREEMGNQMTIVEFVALAAKQVADLIEKPPTPYRDEDITDPTPGCDCHVCRAKRAYKEAKARAH